MSSADPPTPDGAPLLGNGLAFSRDPFGALERWAELGSVVHLSFPGQSLYMVTDPALIEQLLVTNESAFTIGRQQRETFSGIEDDAVSATTGDHWKRLRKSLRPAFTWNGIREYGPQMADRTATHLERWDDGEQVDLLNEMRLLTLRILGDTLLGIDIEGDEAVVRDAADALLARTDPRRFGRLLPEWVPTPTDRRFERAVERLDAYVAGVLADRSPGTDDVASVLLAAHDRGDLSLAEAQDNLTALLLAGHDSSAVALTYAWYELSRHPAIRESLCEEVDAVLDGDRFTPGDFDALTQTRHVVDEVLRLYPPVWAVNRELTEPLALGGYELPTGAQVMCPQWVVHRDERFWEAPTTFDPSRWDHESDRPEYAYFPFSGGPRHCIGMRFARLELVVALATVLDRVTLDVSTTEPLTFAPTLSLQPETELETTVRSR